MQNWGKKNERLKNVSTFRLLFDQRNIIHTSKKEAPQIFYDGNSVLPLESVVLFPVEMFLKS